MVRHTDTEHPDLIVHRTDRCSTSGGTIVLRPVFKVVDELVHILQEFCQFTGRHRDLIIVDVVLHGLTILEDPAGTLDRTLI
jgi:hypothetical protein